MTDAQTEQSEEIPKEPRTTAGTLWPSEPDPFLEEAGSPFSFLYKSHVRVFSPSKGAAPLHASALAWGDLPNALPSRRLSPV